MLLATAPTPFSWRVVKAAVREQCREVRSYAAVVKAQFSESHPKDPGLQRPTPAPCQSTMPPGARPLRAHTLPHPPTEDPRDALIASLLAALRAVGD
ncbi:hypothetical protein MRX96_017422 [Rhipicephalus microplus]